MNKADWMTAVAGIVGILCVGLGLWWADAVAAGFIALDVLRDGIVNLKQSIADLMDGRPTTVGDRKVDDIPEVVCRRVESLEWIDRAGIRLREEGHLLVGELFLVVNDMTDLVTKLRQAVDVAQGVHWRIGDLVPTVVDSLDEVENR